MKEQVKSASQVDNQDDEDEEDDAVVETEVGFYIFFNKKMLLKFLNLQKFSVIILHIIFVKSSTQTFKVFNS